MMFSLQNVFFSVLASVLFSTCIVFAKETSKREILEQKRGAKIDTFYYANYADAVNDNDDVSHNLEPNDCFQGIMVLQYKGIGKWDIYNYDFTELLSYILHETRMGEELAKEMGEEPSITDDNTIIKQMYKRLKELTIEDITEYIDTNTLMSSTNTKPELIATINNPIDHSMFVIIDGKYQTITSKYPFDFTVYHQVEVSVPSNNKNGFVGEKSCSKIIHISDTLINNSRSDIPSYPLAGIWFMNDANQHHFLSHQKTFSYTLKTGESIEKYSNLGLCFIAKVKDTDKKEYLVLFNEDGRKELSIQSQAMIHDNQYMMSGDYGNGYERGEFAVISDEKEVYILDMNSGNMIKAPKGYKAANIDNVSTMFPQLSNYLSDYFGMYPIFSKSKKHYFYNGKTFIEFSKKYLKTMPFYQWQ